MKQRACFLSFLFWLTSFACFAQKNSGLQVAISQFNKMRERLPIEKVYVQTDKPYYVLGDTLRFKAYVLNGDYFQASTRSGLLYVELDNEFGRAIKRLLVPIAVGLSWGDIPLNGEELPEGSYSIRAYTNWMLNFSEDYVFKKDIYISALSNSTLVRAAFKLDSVNGKKKVQGKIRLMEMDNNDLRLKDMQLRVLSGRRTLQREKLATGMDGTLAVNFDLADKVPVKDLAVQLVRSGRNADTTKLTIPVNINRPENTDLQFMPEGGALVANIRTKVGFKAIGEDGKAVSVYGKVYNGTQEVTSLRSGYKGMGNFELTPMPGAKYTARVILSDGVTKTYPLPIVETNGTALRVTPKGPDSVTVTISMVSESPETFTYNLLSHARGVVCYAQSVRMVSGQSVSKTIATSVFPTGVVRFTLLNSVDRPLNERQVFINHNDALQFDINTHRPAYAPRDSIGLDLDIKDKNGKPMFGSFSVAVTDDSQVKTDTLGVNILTDLLLTSDLKGDIDEPGYYFASAGRAGDLDNLMLTQGWTGYDMRTMSAPITEPIKYPAEREFMIQGKVTNLFNKPVENSNVVLFSKKPSMIMDTVTNKGGIFTFKGFIPVDTATFQLTSHNKRGKNGNYGIDILNEFRPPTFRMPDNLPTPWYVNSDTTLLNNSITKLAQINREADLRGEGNRLKEVKIREKKIVKGSKHLVEPTDYDQVFDEQDMLKLGKTTLTELLQKKVKGFQLIGMGAMTPFSKPFYTSYVIDRQLVYFVIDGMPMNSLFKGGGMGPIADPDRYNFLRSETDYFTAEDIKGIEVLKNASASWRYGSRFVTTDDNMNSVAIPPTFTYIEITTRSGHGPYMKRTPGTYLYKPIPFTLPKQVYTPRYTAKNKNVGLGTDLRSTIYWNPHVVADSTGRAKFSFYAADKPGTYTLIMEGADLNGNVGYRRQKIVVRSQAN